MVPYRGRLALRIARVLLALACLAWYVRAADERFTSVVAVLAYLVYSPLAPCSVCASIPPCAPASP